jgi:hypothetical protein
MTRVTCKSSFQSPLAPPKALPVPGFAPEPKSHRLVMPASVKIDIDRNSLLSAYKERAHLAKRAARPLN